MAHPFAQRPLYTSSYFPEVTLVGHIESAARSHSVGWTTVSYAVLNFDIEDAQLGI